MTTWLCGVEQRWAMAAPSCFVTTFRRNMENELPADTEQCPPQALALGLDHDDFLAALAPKPIIILGKERDYLRRPRRRGSPRAAASGCTNCSAPRRTSALFIGPTTHGYTQENREAMYRWFNRVTKVSDATTEPPLTIEKDQTAVVYAEGPGRANWGPHTVFQFTREQVPAAGRPRPALDGEALAKAVCAVAQDAADSLPPGAESRPPGLPHPAVPTRRKLPAAAGRSYAVRNRTGHPGAVSIADQESW